MNNNLQTTKRAPITIDAEIINAEFYTDAQPTQTPRQNSNTDWDFWAIVIGMLGGGATAAASGFGGIGWDAYLLEVIIVLGVATIIKLPRHLEQKS